MVMRNRHDAPGSSDWWEDLPPRVRERITVADPLTRVTEIPTPPPAEPARIPGSSTLSCIRELSRLGLLFLAVAVANVLFLLVALSFVSSGAAPFAVPGR